jgi:hypothetical protein
MSEATIAVSEGVRRKLQELAAQSGRSVAEVLERAVEEYHSQQFWRRSTGVMPSCGRALRRGPPNKRSAAPGRAP